jgi:hypothetical protein
MTSSFKKRSYQVKSSLSTKKHDLNRHAGSNHTDAPVALSPVSTNTIHPRHRHGKHGNYSPKFFRKPQPSSIGTNPHLYGFTVGAIDTEMEMDYLRKNQGPIDSFHEVEFSNNSPGAINTKGKRLRRSNNIGPVDTADELNYKGKKETAQLTPLNNLGPIDTVGELTHKGGTQNLPLSKLPDPVDDDIENTSSNIPRM